MLQNVGFWRDIVTKKMPHTRFILQSDTASLLELIGNSVLPCFATDMSSRAYGESNNTYRVNIPITDPEANVQYYAVFYRKDGKRFESVLP